MIKGSLYRKLLFYFLIVIVVTLASVGISTYSKSSKELDTQIRRHMSQIINNAINHTDLYLKSYERSIIALLTNRDVKKFVDLPSRPESYDYYNYRKLIKEVGLQPILIRYPEILSIYIISFEGNAVYDYNGIPDETFTSAEIEEHLNQLLEYTKPDGSLSIMNSSIFPAYDRQVVRLARQIKGYSSPEYKGILAIEIKSVELSTLWNGVDLGEDGYFFIVDKKGRIVYHPDSERILTEVTGPLKDNIFSSDEKMFTAEEDGRERMFMSRKSDYSGWNLVVSMPLDEIKKPVSSIRMTTIVVGLFTLGFASLLAYRFGLSITRPIQVLKRGMRQTEKGNWAMIPLPEQKDEITELMVRYNLMVNRLSELVEQVYEAELTNQETQMERQKAEFQSLQLQINPHFLYNTLETIVCYAAVQESEEISDIVKAMAYMLRYSIQTNLEEITVANELNHVLNYMIILRHRIEREFEIDVPVPPRLLLKKMVRLTLQPLVENVFQHAFPDGVEEYHWIRIDAEETEDHFRVIVEDNGAGIASEDLLELQRRLRTNRLADDEDDPRKVKGGIGVLNVHRRIQMVFGEQYGLHIESEEGRGTKMIMIMPLQGDSLKPKEK
ncbi:sensor histidine kinase [Paenibacillus sp. J2TS4]|uniref:sensor histidine kinase n=1 Tax=Paenibacillus sp. J2TS4 TaxID=2807194 RepID=UPI001B02A36C|nr:histidine kinase [Paenibacillus sp. J2TS4]GIP36181.1 histidine kinase [Paenibacillus sp. J2TS4]